MDQHAHELTIGLSFILGALHALEPGHGKTAMIVYLLGGKRSLWHPLVMGVTTAVSHSASLIGIAFLVHLTHHLVTHDHHHEADVSAILQWVSATLLVAIGTYLIVQTIRGKKQRCCHQDHPHVHECSNNAQVNHQPPIQLHQLGISRKEPRRIGSLKMTALLGLAVGLLPCPSAMAAYFASLSSGSPTTAYMIIALFGAGIACSLTVVGLLLQCFGDRLGARLHTTSRIPWGKIRALLILGIGLVYVGRMIIA